MSVKLMSAIFETEFRDLPDEEGNVTKASTAKLVLLALADHANDEGEGAYPGLGRMEIKTSLSRQTLINAYDALKYNGIIFLVGVSRRGTNNYTINTRSFPKADDGSKTALLVKPLDSDSQATLPEVVKPLDPNHHITIKENIPLSIENAIATNQPITEAMAERASIENNAPRLFEKSLGFSKPLPWWNNKEWTAFAEWVIERHTESPTCFGEYNIWRNTPYTKGGMANTRIRGFVSEFYDSWDMFMMSREPAKNTPKQEEGKSSGYYA